MRKRLIKQMGVFCLSLALLAGGAVGVRAAEHEAIPPKEGSLTIHKYLMDDLDQAANSNNGYEAGKEGNPAVPAEATPLEGIKFDVYQIIKDADSDWPGEAPYRMDGSKITDKAGDEFAITPLNPLTYTTDANGEITISNMKQGAYFVTEQPDPRVTTPCEPFVVSVPMTNPDGDGWITDVHVYPKNEKASADKIIVDSSNTDNSSSAVTIGDTIGYEIRPSVPSSIIADDPAEDAKIKFVIYDILDAALTLQESTITVKAVDGQEPAVETALLVGTDYTVNLNATLTDKNDPLNPVTGPFAIEFTEAGRQKLYTLDAKTLKIKFDVVVNEAILENDDREVGNDALVSFTNQWGVEQQTGTDEVVIHTGIIEIKKINATDKSPLGGAEFQIALTEDDAKAGKFLKKLKDSPAAGQKTIIDFNHPDYNSPNAEPWIETSGADGLLRFEGLADYTSSFDADGVESIKSYLSYWIVETKAPDGFNLLDAPRELTFTETNSGKDLAAEENSYVMAGIEVENTNDFTLPKTGGIGTILFTIGGIILIGGAALLLISGKKKKMQA